MGHRLRVLAEETLASVDAFNNGAGPMWCYGSSTIVRDGSTVYCTVPEVGAGVAPLCNTRWNLRRRVDGGTWERVYQSPAYDEREPCPLVRLRDGCVVVSTNAAVPQADTPAEGRRACRCTPRLAVFDVAARKPGPEMLAPDWSDEFAFSEHSYRGLGTDADTGALFLAHQAPDPSQAHEYVMAWAYRERDGRWSRSGVLRFPMRGCYPQIAVRGRAVYVMAISDEIEPVPAWREHKRAVTGRDWDYDFRQLFFTWTPDIAARPFSPPLTVASRDETAGFISNLDLWVASDGDAYLLYLDRNIWHAFMRDRFWPAVPLTVALKMARVRNGRVAQRWTLHEWVGARAGEGCQDAPARSRVGWAVYHADVGGRL